MCKEGLDEVGEKLFYESLENLKRLLPYLFTLRSSWSGAQESHLTRSVVGAEGVFRMTDSRDYPTAACSPRVSALLFFSFFFGSFTYPTPSSETRIVQRHNGNRPGERPRAVPFPDRRRSDRQSLRLTPRKPASEVGSCRRHGAGAGRICRSGGRRRGDRQGKLFVAADARGDDSCRRWRQRWW